MNAMQQSMWVTNGQDYELMVFAPIISHEHEDIKLCELIGDLDPFVKAVETGEDVVLEQVAWNIDQATNEKRNVG